VTMTLIELEPGAVVPEHGHEQEQVGLLLHGSMTFCVGGETRELGPGGTWCIPGNVPHSVVAGPGVNRLAPSARRVICQVNTIARVLS